MPHQRRRHESGVLSPESPLAWTFRQIPVKPVDPSLTNNRPGITSTTHRSVVGERTWLIKNILQQRYGVIGEVAEGVLYDPARLVDNGPMAVDELQRAQACH